MSETVINSPGDARQMWDDLRAGRVEYPPAMWAEYPIRFRVVSPPRLRAARRRAKLSQQTVADRLGVSITMVTRSEAGERTMTADEVVAVAAAIGVGVDEVLES